MSKLETDDVRIHFTELGSAHGEPVLLLHGWPDDASTWDDVIARLPDNRYRLIVPTIRGFGESVFKSDDAPRTANNGILAMDAIALMDGLGIERFAAVGHDWGSAIAEALAIGWPDRVSKLALLSSMPRMGAWRRLPSGTRNSTGTRGSWRRSVARKLSPKIAGASRTFCGRTGRRTDGSTKRRSNELRSPSTIQTGLP